MVHKFTTGKRQFNWFNLLMVIAMSFGSMTYGYSASIISTTLAQPSFLTYFELDTRSDATSLISTMNGLYQVSSDRVDHVRDVDLSLMVFDRSAAS